MTAAPLHRAVVFGVLLCFFLSGAAGLIYQVAWSKALGLIFGHTVYAIATVLAVFMGGLALGSAWLGRWSERHARPIALYGWVELGVAAMGAFSLAGLGGLRAVYLAAYHLVANSPAALLALRFAGAAVVLFLPTFLMGGTLPIVVRGLTRSSAELGLRVSRLYWVNTAGAVAGTLAAGFLFLPTLGLRLTVAAGVALNVLAGSTALLLSGSVSEILPARPETTSQPPEDIGSAGRQRSLQFLLAGFAVVGATAMAYEISWTRLLATMLGSSVYAFALMLATFLAGLALGSALFERWLAHSHTGRLATFARTQMFTAVAALLFLAFFQQLPRVVPPLLRATHETFGGLVCAQFLASALAMLPAATIFGFNFPAVTLLIAGRGETGRHALAVGRAYAANTLGAIGGAVTTGFWLVPRLGSFRVIALAAAANLLLALALELRSDAPQLRRWLAAATDAALLAAVVAVAGSGALYNRSLATFGTVLYWNLYEGRLSLAETAATTDIVFAADGLNASISVARAEDYFALRTNGKVDASNHDATTQLLVGHLGAIFHPAPRRVLVIGFGSGMTVSAVARYSEVKRIDCVEIEPAVIRAAAHLGPLNRGVLRDPRLHVIFDDARNFLLTTREQYDLIISEPSNPWIAGVATLFTDEYYRAACARLAPGGIFVQWLQAYSLAWEDLRMVLNTFVPHFPRTTLWHGDAPDLLLLGQTEPAPLDLDRLRARWANAELRADYEMLGLRQPEGLFAFYLLDDDNLRRLAAGAQRNTDDRTLLEYRAPRALLVKHLEESNRERILEFQGDLLPPEVPGARRAAVLEAAGETMLNLDEKEEAERFLAPLDDAATTLDLAILRGRLALAHAALSAARENFQTALRIDPQSLEAAQGLADVARRRGERVTAELLLRQILARDPKFVPALDAMMSLARDRKDWPEAARWQTQRIAADRAPGAEQYSRLGELLLRSGDLVGAERALHEALEREPYSSDAHRYLAELCRFRALWPQARKHMEFIVRYSPDADAEVYRVLAEVDRAMGDPNAAKEALRKGRRIFPNNAELRNSASPE